MNTEQRDRLARAIEGIDTNSSDGRAGLRTLLREIESVAPGVIENEAAGLLLARVRERLN